MTWQTIESAPRGTKHIMLFGDGPGFLQCVYIGTWGNGCWLEAFSHKDSATFPTHWQPVPEPPVQS